MLLTPELISNEANQVSNWLDFTNNRNWLIFITSNYRETWFPNWQMSIVVSTIAEVCMNKIALWIHVGVDDWRDERATIASNVAPKVSKKPHIDLETKNKFCSFSRFVKFEDVE